MSAEIVMMSEPVSGSPYALPSDAEVGGNRSREVNAANRRVMWKRMTRCFIII
jgi:hypothetical protein